MSDANANANPAPALSIADVVFAEATPRQRTLSWQLNGASWAPPLTLEQYVGREQTLSETALSANGGTRYWVLHRKDDPDTVVAGCETTAKKALVADAGLGGASRLVDAYSIASVFTAPQHRGRGLASHMLRKLQEVVDETTECGALYSDIGRAYYSGLGWRDFRSPQVTFCLGEGFEAAPPLPASGSSGDVSLLTEGEVAALCERDVAALTRKFDRLAQHGDGGKSGRTHVAFLPSFVQCAWHFARDTYVAGVMRGGREVRHRGAATADRASWLYWDHDLRDQKLKIQRVVTTVAGDSGDDAQQQQQEEGEGREEKKVADVMALLLAALAEAKDWGLPKVLIWSPDRVVSAAATEIWREQGEKLQLVYDERQDGSIPSLRWKGGKNVGEIVWEDNEYFSWC